MFKGCPGLRLPQVNGHWRRALSGDYRGAVRTNCHPGWPRCVQPRTDAAKQHERRHAPIKIGSLSAQLLAAARLGRHRRRGP